MGYSGPAVGGTCRRDDIPVVRKEMVRVLPQRSSSMQWLDNVPSRTLRRGKHRMILWPDREADGANETTTPSKLGARDESGRLEKVRAPRPQEAQLAIERVEVAPQEV